MKLHKKFLIVMAIYLISLILILIANGIMSEVHKRKNYSLVEVNQISMFQEPIKSIIELPETVLPENEYLTGVVDATICDDVDYVVNEDIYEEVQVYESEALSPLVSFVSMGIPDIDSSFKTYMPWQAWLGSQNSAQYKFYKNYGWIDSQGFVRCTAEKELGIPDDYYMVALGSYYGTTLGTKYRITLDTGRVFYAILGEFKDNAHTNSSNQYSLNNNDIVEFVVDTNTLNPNVKISGSANSYMPLNGRVTKVERIEFDLK